MLVSYHLLSNRGNRTKNEDCIGSYEKDGEYCFVLADGLGGHEKGEVASRMVVDTAVNLFKRTGFDEFYMRNAFEIGQEELIKRQVAEIRYDDYKSTMVLLCIKENMINWGHIGDSRLYLFQNKKKILHTLDHSVPQFLVNAGEIEDKDIRNHPDRSRILRAMGIEWERPKYDIAVPIEPEKKMAFLLATDGFWELIEDEDMVKCLKKAKDVHEWLKNMEKIVIVNGISRNMDNFSAIGVFVN